MAVELRVVAGDVRRHRLRGRHGLARAQDADLLVDVVGHADRAPQRDLVRRVAADDRILHVEIRIGDRRLDAARERDALLDEARLQPVARIEHVRHEIGRHRHVVEIALLEGEQPRIRFLDDADLDATGQRQLPAAKLRERAIVGMAALGIALVAKRRIRLEHDPLAAAPVLEPVGSGPDRIRHHPAGAVRVGFDDLARDGRGRDGRQVRQELVVGEVELAAASCSGRWPAGPRSARRSRTCRSPWPSRRSPPRRRSGRRELCSEFERILGIEHALHRVHVVGGRELPALSLEHRVVGEIDARPDADRPRPAVGRDLRHARRRVRHELVRPREVVVPVERIEDRAIDAVRILVAGRLRVEARLRRRERDAQHLVRVGLRRRRRRQRTRMPTPTTAAATALAEPLIAPALQQLLDVAGEARRLDVRRIALDDVALRGRPGTW